MCYEENRFQLAGRGGHTGNLYLVKAASMYWEAYWQRRCVCRCMHISRLIKVHAHACVSARMNGHICEAGGCVPAHSGVAAYSGGELVWLN